MGQQAVDMKKPPKDSPPPRSDDEPDPVEMPLEDHLDLHAFRPREILEVVEEYLRLAVDAGFREVRIIHGKGTGFQRDRVRKLLEEHPLVEEFGDAPVQRGHWGSTLVRLRPGREGPAGQV